MEEKLSDQHCGLLQLYNRRVSTVEEGLSAGLKTSPPFPNYPLSAGLTMRSSCLGKCRSVSPIIFFIRRKYCKHRLGAFQPYLLPQWVLLVFPRLCSFSNLSITSSTSQLILQPFCRFTYVTAHSPTLPLFHLHHSSFSNPSFASPTSQALHLRHLTSRPWCENETRKRNKRKRGRKKGK